MNALIRPLTPEQQNRLSRDLYILLEKQVKSYHKSRHMGENSSVPAEIAQELLQSVWYTLEISGGYTPDVPLDLQLLRGQESLKKRLEDARKLHRLVSDTAPDFRTDFHWDTVEALGRWLETYDPLHFAHRIPDMPDYPLLVPVPEELKGLEYGLFYLNALWQENQALHSLSGPALEALYLRCPPGWWDAPQNLCEQPLFNALALAMLGLPPGDLTLSESQEETLLSLCTGKDLASLLSQAANRLQNESDLPADLLHAAAAQLKSRLEIALAKGELSTVFI